MENSFSHLIAVPGSRPKARELARHTAPVFDVTRLDEAQRLRYCGGWYLRDGTATVADELEKILVQQEIAAIRLQTPEPIAPVNPERVISADLENETLFLETSRELVDVKIASLRAIDLGVVGESQSALNQQQAEMHRWAEAMLTGLSYPEIRASLLGCGLRRPNPQGFLAVPERERLLRVERGTRFPVLCQESGPQALDSLLLFIDRLLTAAAPGVALPEVTTFWHDAVIEPVLRHRIEERDQRLSWLSTWLQHSEQHRSAVVDKEETNSGDPAPEPDPEDDSSQMRPDSRQAD